MEEMLVWTMKKKKYHCSFCEKYPSLTAQGIKKVYIFDDLMPQYMKKDDFAEYYQCVDADTTYP